MEKRDAVPEEEQLVPQKEYTITDNLEGLEKKSISRDIFGKERGRT